MSKKGGREGAYTKANDANASREERMTRLKFELREHIRFLADYEVFSTEWLRMAESLHQIANVAFMETHLPAAEKNPLKQAGKKEKGTLWDQEKDELAVRILLEEGKLNLALRVLHKYKKLTRETVYDELVKATVTRFNSDLVTVSERCRVFEQSLGVLLKYAFQHVEALQIMDVPEFMEHIMEVIREAEKSDKKDVQGSEQEKMQETVVLFYLSGLAKNMEDMDEDRVMDLVDRNNLFPLLVSHLVKHSSWYRLDALKAACVFFSHCMASDAYTTEPDRYVKNEDDKKAFVNLKGLFISEMVENYGLKKIEIQSLWDNISQFEKAVGPAKVTPLVVKK